MAPRDVPAVGGEHLGVGGDIGVGELGPTPHTRHDDAAQRHWVEVPNLRDTFGEKGWNFLKRGPPTPDPKVLLLCQRRGSSGIPGLIFTPRGVERQLKIFRDDFFVAAAPCLHHLVPPHLAIPCFHKPPKHNVAVPINKVEGPWRSQPCRGRGRGCPSPHEGGQEGVRCGGGVDSK